MPCRPSATAWMTIRAERTPGFTCLESVEEGCSVGEVSGGHCRGQASATGMINFFHIEPLFCYAKMPARKDSR